MNPSDIKRNRCRLNARSHNEQNHRVDLKIIARTVAAVLEMNGI